MSSDEYDELDEYTSENIAPEDQNEVAVERKKRIKYPKLVINVSETQYPVVKAVGKKIFKWRLSYDPEEDWDVWWTDMAVQPETLARMKPYQKINHFPGMYSLARKNHLGKSLMKMQKQFPQEYKFFPQTWCLPSELSDFRQQFNFKSEVNGKKKVKTFIVKPDAGCQGRGIYLVRGAEEIPMGEHCIVQKYMTQPHLLEGLKYDLRIYVLVAGCDPLRIYVYKEGLARLATEQYVPPNHRNLNDMCMHLTNYAVNKNSEKFVFNTDKKDFSQGHKRSYTYVMQMLKESGADVEKLEKEIHQLLVKTLCAGQPILAHNYRSCQPDNHANNMCFEILGMDVLLDSKLRPYLLEVNHTPSFTTDTPLDKSIKKGLIKDSLLLLDIHPAHKAKIKILLKQQFHRRVIDGRKVKVTPQERAELVAAAQRARDQYERANSKNFQCIYPPDDADQLALYQEFQAHALLLYQQSTGANIRRHAKPSPAFRSGSNNPNTVTHDIHKIYTNKLKPNKKYTNIKSKVQCHNTNYRKNEPVDDSVPLQPTQEEQHALSLSQDPPQEQSINHFRIVTKLTDDPLITNDHVINFNYNFLNDPFSTEILANLSPEGLLKKKTKAQPQQTFLEMENIVNQKHLEQKINKIKSSYNQQQHHLLEANRVNALKSHSKILLPQQPFLGNPNGNFVQPKLFDFSGHTQLDNPRLSFNKRTVVGKSTQAQPFSLTKHFLPNKHPSTLNNHSHVNY